MPKLHSPQRALPSHCAAFDGVAFQIALRGADRKDQAMMELVRPQSPASEMSGHSDMVWIPGGTFRMGSDKHYAEEAPVHRVTVDGFWIDRTPVTNRQFRNFVQATGHVTYAEIAPDPKDYPGALPDMLKAAC